jgi:hypothetical protein
MVEKENQDEQKKLCLSDAIKREERVEKQENIDVKI